MTGCRDSPAQGESSPPESSVAPTDGLTESLPTSPSTSLQPSLPPKATPTADATLAPSSDESIPLSTAFLDETDLVAQLLAQTFVQPSVEDVNAGVLRRVGTVVMPEGTRLMGLGSVGVTASMTIFSVPDRGAVVMLTTPQSREGEVVAGVQVDLGSGERIETHDCSLDGLHPSPSFIAVLPAEPEFGDGIPARRAWRIDEAALSIDPIDPARLVCSLSNPD